MNSNLRKWESSNGLPNILPANAFVRYMARNPHIAATQINGSFGYVIGRDGNVVEYVWSDIMCRWVRISSVLATVPGAIDSPYTLDFFYKPAKRKARVRV